MLEARFPYHSFIYYGYTTLFTLIMQVYRKQYVRNRMKILLSRGRHVHRKTYKQKQNSVDEIGYASRDFPGDF